MLPPLPGACAACRIPSLTTPHFCNGTQCARCIGVRAAGGCWVQPARGRALRQVAPRPRQRAGRQQHALTRGAMQRRCSGCSRVGPHPLRWLRFPGIVDTSSAAVASPLSPSPTIRSSGPLTSRSSDMRGRLAPGARHARLGALNSPSLGVARLGAPCRQRSGLRSSAVPRSGAVRPTCYHENGTPVPAPPSAALQVS